MALSFINSGGSLCIAVKVIFPYLERFVSTMYTCDFETSANGNQSVYDKVHTQDDFDKIVIFGSFKENKNNSFKVAAYCHYHVG